MLKSYDESELHEVRLEYLLFRMGFFLDIFRDQNQDYFTRRNSFRRFNTYSYLYVKEKYKKIED